VTDLVFTCSGGLPRLINVVCDALLVFGYAEDRHAIDRALTNEVIKELEATGVLAAQRPPAPAATPAVAASMAAAAVAPAAPIAHVAPVAPIDPGLIEREEKVQERERAIAARERELTEQRRVFAEEYRLLRRSAAPPRPTLPPRPAAEPLRRDGVWWRLWRALAGVPASAIGDRV
jgi:hypothetical protein